ncbi:CPBP family intramembrane metalloprotease [Methylomonas sp. SURF-2]|uniref:CPBP family intramembrane metalloprotease n=1 Tax=Methylomonas subterranea TaxID=2952225 RepID=A0ABT1TL14_9GAMM|nr:CPBP family intramembrane glutamic endopeptidase [Methylomonas sp. SURF-2]MCQ8106153.1 CPBP family intramembrane metalloprotease [Methylomonas sp. SURF-2]
MGRLTMILAPPALIVLLSALASLLGFGLLQLAGDLLPLHKVISKLTLILLILSIFPLRTALRLSWTDLGFAPAPKFFKQMGQGLLFAVLTLAPVLLLLYALDVHVWDSSRSWTFGKVLEKAAISLFLALLIGVVEEMLFRGLLLSALRRHMPLLAAIGVSAFYYAALHFFKSQTHIPYAEQTLGSGFRLMAEAFVNWLDPVYLSALLALFVVGVFLAVLRTRVPQSLGLCVGCHAGWVWQIKFSKDLCNLNPLSEYLYLVNTAYDGVVGPLVGAWLAMAVWGWLLIGQPARSES